MVNIALVQDNIVVNVGVFNDEIWDFATWERFQAEFDDLIEVVDGAPWIGWTRPSVDDAFVAPVDPNG